MVIEGFKECTSLAHKLGQTLASLSTSLPRRHKYQLGVRSIPIILNLAKEVMKRQPEVDELDTVPLALREYLIPQLREEDAPIFKEMFQIMFPEFDIAPYVNDILKDGVTAMMKSNNLIVKDSYIDKVLQLHDAISRNQTIILFGKSGSGKSTSLTTLENVYNKLNSEGNASYKATKREIINPLIVEDTTLYGPYEDVVGKTNEGFLARLVRKSQKSSSGFETWIVFDGPYGHPWLHDFFAHLDAKSNSFMGNNRQSIPLPSNLKFIIEVAGDIGCLTPAELTSCFGVFFPAQPQLWEEVVHSWLGTLTNYRITRALQSLVKKNLPNFINILQESEVKKPHMIMKARAFVAILNYFLDTELTQTETEDWVERLTPAFIFGIIWSFGACISSSEADEFREVVTRTIENVPEGGIYDYCVDISSGQFKSWAKFTTEMEMYNPFVNTNIVMTDRIIKYSKVSQILMSQGIPVILKGNPGSGKSTLINVLRQTMNSTTDLAVVSYTSFTQPKDIQKTIEENLIKQGKDILAGRKSKLHLLVDDLHCSEGENHMHQVLATTNFTAKYRKLFNHEIKSFLGLPEICYLFTYQTKECVSGGQDDTQMINNHVENFWMGSFHLLTLPSCENAELESIFCTLFDQNLGHFEQEVKCLKIVVAEGIVHLYRRMGEVSKQVCGDHLPLVHHPRQVISVLKGLQLGDEETQDRDNFLKHLAHECFRVFQDVGVIQPKEFESLINDVLSEYLCISLDKVCDNPSMFLLTRLASDDNLYTDIQADTVRNVLKSAGQALLGPKGLFAIYDSLIHHTIHLIRILGKQKSREIKSSSALDSIGGHLILIGPEGCGKKTCARLVSSIAGFKTYDINGTESEAETKREDIIKDLTEGISVLVIIDWNVLDDLRNIAFLNDLLVEKQNIANPHEAQHTVRILISTPTLKEAYDILKYIPAVSNYYNVDSFQEWNTEELQTVAKQILMEKLGQSLPELKAQAVAEVMAYIHQNNSEAKWQPSCRFLGFLKSFLHLHDKLLTGIIEEKEKLNMSIIKFEDTQKRVTELSKQLEEQRAQVTYIQQTCGSVVLKMRNIKSEQGRLEQDLNKNLGLLKRQKDESLRIRELINRDLTAPKQEMKATHRKLDRITRAELETLKSLSRPPPSVELVFDAVLTTLGLDPSWNEAKKQMSSGLNFISSIRKIPVEETDEKILTRIQAYLKMEDLNMEKVTEESFTAATFLSWLCAFEKYVRVYKDYHPLKVQADIITREIEATETTINQYQEDLTGFGMEHKVLMAQLKEKEHQLEVAEEEMKVLESRIQLAQKVMTQLGEDKIHWEEALSQCSVKLRNIFGDAVLAAAYVTYLGTFNHEERPDVIKSWQDKMNELCIFNTEDRTSLDILAPMESQAKWHEEGLPMDNYLLENAAIISNSDLPQLILDPHCLLETWIHKRRDALEINLEEEEFMDQFNEAISKGRSCIITLEELSFPIKVFQILEMEQVKSSSKDKTLLKVGNETYELHKDFRLFIILKSNIDYLDNNIKTLVNVVDMQSNQEGMMKLLTMRVASHCQPDLIESLKKSEFDLLEKQNQLAEQEATIRSLMARFDDDVLEESTLMEMLQAACAKATDAKKKCHDLRKSLDAAKEGIKTYGKISGLLTEIYILVERLPLFNPSLVIGIDRFSALVIGEMQPQNFANAWGRLLDANTVIKMLQTIFRYFQDQVDDIALVTIGLVLAMWYECHIGLTTPQFCSLLHASSSSQIGSELSSLESEKKEPKGEKSCSVPKSSHPVWLTDSQWLQILSLSKVEPFTNLIESLTTHEKLWRVWYVTEQPETVPLPNKLERKIRGVAKLILINCLRPDRLDEASMIYVERVLRVEADPTSAKALLAVAGKGSPTEPVIIYSSAPLDVEHILGQIQPLCHPVLISNPDSVNVLALSEGREDYLNLIFQKCCQKGFWLLLKKDTEAESCINHLCKLLKDKCIKEAHKRFQIWMYLQEEDTLPTNLMMSCHKVYLSLPQTVKESIMHLYELIGESRLNAYTNEWSKWCLMSLALFHIGFVTRQAFEDPSTPLAQTIGDDQWEEAEACLRSLVSGAHTVDGTLVPALLEQLTSIYINGAVTEESYIILTRLLNEYLSNEAIQNISSRVSALTHYSVPRSTSMEDHTAQMEYIYLAQNVSLTHGAPTLIFENQRKEAESIIIAMRRMDKASKSEIATETDYWIKMFTPKPKKESSATPAQTSLQLILRQEFEHYIKTSESVFSKLKQTDDIESVSEILESPDLNLVQNQQDADECDVETLLCKMLWRGHYLTGIVNQPSPIKSIRLGLLQEPAAAWAAFIRNNFGEVRAPGMEVAVVTQALWDSLGFKAEGDSRVIDEEDEITTLVLEKLALGGASWDADAEVIIPEDLAAATPFFTVLNFTIMQFTSNVKKELKKIGEAYCTPVYVGCGMDTPLFWLHLPLSPAISCRDCHLRGVRLIAT
ncbi:dynein heavy chain 2, axonemal-like [Penaeus monodon]|uniref:dynein heavy chain 2, axonemal-like n=1 Tax=Penaeus monodon TaxID=6687 RepID=UPI0018A7A6B8|nr:dynein heavy chain 2, axonemal-like [Penaeus monodon]